MFRCFNIHVFTEKQSFKNQGFPSSQSGSWIGTVSGIYFLNILTTKTPIMKSLLKGLIASATMLAGNGVFAQAGLGVTNHVNSTVNANISSA